MRFFRATCALTIRGQAHVLREAAQRRDQLLDCHVAEDPPRLLGDGHHHPLRRLGDLVGDIIEGKALIHGARAMHAPQRRQHDREHILGNEGQTQTQQRRFGIAQGVEFGVKRGFEMLEGGCQRPALAIEAGDPLRRHRVCGEMGQESALAIPITRGLIEEHLDPSKALHLALGIADVDALLGHLPRCDAPCRTPRRARLIQEPVMLSGEQAGLGAVHGTEQGPGTVVAIVHPAIVRVARLHDLSHEGPRLGMPIFTGKDVTDQALAGLVHDEGCAGQRPSLDRPQHVETSLTRLQTVAIEHCHPLPRYPGGPRAVQLRDQRP